MTTYPIRRADFTVWGQSHAETFSANAVAIGLTPAQALAFSDAISLLQTASVAQDKARDNAKAATEGVNDAFAAAKQITGETLKRIRLFAETTNNPNVYQVANIPSPSAPSPVPPPGTPTDFKIELDTSGAITLKFKCQNPSNGGGVTYLVRRKLPGENTFSIIGSSGKRSYTDPTLPAGVTSAEYTIQAQRAGKLGPVSLAVLVRIGSGAGGGPGGVGLSTMSTFSVGNDGQSKPVKFAA